METSNKLQETTYLKEGDKIIVTAFISDFLIKGKELSKEGIELIYAEELTDIKDDFPPFKLRADAAIAEKLQQYMSSKNINS